LTVKKAVVISVHCVREYEAAGGYNAAASEVRRRDTGIAVQLLHHAMLMERCCTPLDKQWVNTEGTPLLMT